MNICIVGWYGSETLGDRAILDGIMCIFAYKKEKYNIFLGSLYPFFTERTIYEDKELYLSHGFDFEIKIFDSYDKKELHKKIEQSDMLIMGGGPLMDIPEMYIVQHAFKYAKTHNVMTVLLGCGYGPLKKKEYQKATVKIAKQSDLIVMRSEICMNKMCQLCGEQIKEKTFFAYDPAVISVISYRQKYIANNVDDFKINTDIWSMNIRDLDYVYNTGSFYYKKIFDVVRNVSEQIPHLILMPMHSFYVGGDDRYIENSISKKLSFPNIKVIQKPLSLKEAYNLFITSKGCVGMRYHSIVFQTYLNGNNYLLDYTDSKYGKITNFLNLIDKDGFYKNRYVNIKETDDKLLIDVNSKSCFEYDATSAFEQIKYYNELLNKAIEGKIN